MKLFPGGNVFEKAAVAVATGFGSGMAAPFAPGTFGSIPGVALAVWLNRAFAGRIWIQAAAAIALAAAAIPFCGVAERVLGVKDDGRIVADEWMLYPLAVIGLPLAEHPWLILCTFATVRVFDIVKPPPANRLQALPGGLGIVADDFAANIYSLAANWAAAHFIFGIPLPF